MPAAPNTSPDYFCTWNIQGYHSSYSSNAAQKDDIRESRLFGAGPCENWLGQHPKARSDLFFLLDEGWDLPDEAVEVLPNRFPSYAAALQPRDFALLSSAVKARRPGLGLWIRADARRDDFWTQRLDWMKTSGVGYWKVDYGNAGGNETWRHHLTSLGRQHAPELTIEAAVTPHAVTWADTYRTYDVDVVLSIPQTLGRVADALKFQAEPGPRESSTVRTRLYGEWLGCSCGVMRHGFTGNLPSGRQDFVFPPVTRDVKRCGDEIVRAVRWHRIAPAFAVGANALAISAESLKDNWRYAQDKSWKYRGGHEQTRICPSQLTGLPLPDVKTAAGTARPYVVASRNPNGAVAVATLGRTICASDSQREWITGEKTDVTLRLGKYTGPIGVLGRYRSLTLVFDQPLEIRQVLARPGGRHPGEYCLVRADRRQPDSHSGSVDRSLWPVCRHARRQVRARPGADPAVSVWFGSRLSERPSEKVL